MNQRLFALIGAVLLAGVAVGPALATAGSTDAGNAPADGNESFGQQVSAFVHQLQNSSNGTGIGDAVSSFVVANNPGNAPAHAGGPGGPNATANGTQGNDTQGGPPGFVQAMFGNDDATDDNETVERRGPPAHAGPGAGEETADDGNETDADANETAPDERNGQGPPDHAGGDADTGSDDDGDEADDGDDAGEAEDEDRGNGQGPPDHAGPP